MYNRNSFSSRSCPLAKRSGFFFKNGEISFILQFSCMFDNWKYLNKCYSKKIHMPEHFLLKNTTNLPKEAILQSSKKPNNLTYLTKTAAAPGDDDDYSSSMNVTSGWNSSFLTKTCAAPGDDDDYNSAMHLTNGWNAFFVNKTKA